MAEPETVELAEFAELLESPAMTEPLIYVSAMPEYKDKLHRPAVKVTMTYSPSMFESRQAAWDYLSQEMAGHMLGVVRFCDELNRVNR